MMSMLTGRAREEMQMINCDTCPRCKDTYPDRVDADGYHFYICGMSGNIVYKEPHKTKRRYGSGYINYGISGCGLYETVDDALDAMKVRIPE